MHLLFCSLFYSLSQHQLTNTLIRSTSHLCRISYLPQDNNASFELHPSSPGGSMNHMFLYYQNTLLIIPFLRMTSASSSSAHLVQNLLLGRRALFVVGYSSPPSRISRCGGSRQSDELERRRHATLLYLPNPTQVRYDMIQVMLSLSRSSAIMSMINFTNTPLA